jgi:hypothetical protein
MCVDTKNKNNLVEDPILSYKFERHIGQILHDKRLASGLYIESIPFIDQKDMKGLFCFTCKRSTDAAEPPIQSCNATHNGTMSTKLVKFIG